MVDKCKALYRVLVPRKAEELQVTPTFSHFDSTGQAHMVDVGEKAVTHRIALAQGSLVMGLKTAEAIRAGEAKKGDVIGIARIAAIQATKKTADLIPLCHPLSLTHVSIEFEWAPDREEGAELIVRAHTETWGKTGVEMEALTAVSVGLLTVFDMCKALDRGMRLERIALLEKHGGKSGSWIASA